MIGESEESIPLRLRYDASRAIAMHLSLLDPAALIVELQEDLPQTPQNLRDELTYLATRSVDDGVDLVLDDQDDPILAPAWKGNPVSVPGLQQYFSTFVISAVSDVVAATLSIGPVRKSRARAIVNDERSQEAVRNLALSGNAEILLFPETTSPFDTDYVPDPLLMFNARAGHLTTTETPKVGGGCPIARGRSELAEQVFGVVSEVTIETVEWPAHHPYFT